MSFRVKPRHSAACHSWPRPRIQGPLRNPLFPLPTSSLFSTLSFRVKPRHPGACHSWPRPGIQGSVIPGLTRHSGVCHSWPRPGIQGPLRNPSFPLPAYSQQCHSRLDQESRWRRNQETSMNTGYRIIPEWIRDQYDIKGMTHCRRGEQADH